MIPIRCAFGASVGRFVGFLIQEKGVEVDTNKTKAFIECAPPHKKKKL